MTPTAKLFVSEREKLLREFEGKLQIAHELNRQTVSFQANKGEPEYRWFKYKEGFSSALVTHFLGQYAPFPGRLLDPFAGSGTSLFAGAELGWKTFGIELLPVGAFAIDARNAIVRADAEKIREAFDLWPNFSGRITKRFEHIRITRHAFSQSTENSLNRYLSYCETLADPDIKTALLFIAFSVLEQISYTRKDGQYLRWDYRSDRELSGKPFDKGFIPSFEIALRNKFDEILMDSRSTSGFLPFEHGETQKPHREDFHLSVGSCLDILPLTESDSIDFVITSPPYCNRYDYTRTYALELAFLGMNDDRVRELRQEMLSCTVENKEKVERMRRVYERLGRQNAFESVMAVYTASEAMAEINVILHRLKDAEKLNNSNIARMVRNYFLEMCLVVFELARVTRSGGYCVMVNDNVRYGGEEIPADLILSQFAEMFGYEVEKILVLPRGKGNSSQQMGEYGRAEIRKCVYVWRKK